MTTSLQGESQRDRRRPGLHREPEPQFARDLTGCKLEPGLAGAAPGSRFQFERLGYFCADPDSAPGKPVFNRTASLRDTWAKIQKRQ